MDKRQQFVASMKTVFQEMSKKATRLYNQKWSVFDIKKEYCGQSQSIWNEFFALNRNLGYYSLDELNAVAITYNGNKYYLPQLVKMLVDLNAGCAGSLQNLETFREVTYRGESEPTQNDIERFSPYWKSYRNNVKPKLEEIINILRSLIQNEYNQSVSREKYWSLFFPSDERWDQIKISLGADGIGSLNAFMLVKVDPLEALKSSEAMHKILKDIKESIDKHAVLWTLPFVGHLKSEDLDILRKEVMSVLDITEDLEIIFNKISSKLIGHRDFLSETEKSQYIAKFKVYAERIEVFLLFLEQDLPNNSKAN